MNWIDQLNQSIDFIETNLDKTIDIPTISRIAGCSPYHYQRMFSLIAEITLGEYIRKRRLTMAAYELQNKEVSVIETALKYGYDSPTSFTKAFQIFHGVSPREARNRNVPLKVVPKMQISERHEFSWRIERKDSFRLVGKSIIVSCENNLHFKKIPEKCRMGNF